jgi:hypothetical protein
MSQEEEENIEDILKSINPWKGFLKGIIVVVFMVTAYITITYFPSWSILGVVLLILSALIMIPELPDQDGNKRLTLSVLKCENIECGNQIVRDYEDGDFVFNIGRICPKCNTNFKIIEIYSKKLDKKSEQEKKEKKRNIKVD